MSRSLVWVIASVMALPVACTSPESEPVEAARAFAEATRRRDVDGMLRLIESKTRERIEASAEKASDQVGGRRIVAPREMLQVVGIDRGFTVAKAELVSSGETEARVELSGPAGQTALVDLVREESRWRVRIPTPEDFTPQR